MKLAHSMIRVADLERSKAFYIEALGMRVFKEKEYPGGEFTLVFVGYEPDDFQLELTYNWDKRTYDVGTGYGHLAIETEDIEALCERIAKAGGEITRPPGPMKHGATVIAFAKDPDGYAIELILRDAHK